MIDGLDLRAYRIPLQRPWRSARGEMRVRSGWLLRVRSGEHLGYGDCAPLPETGTEDHDQAFAALAGWRTRLAGISIESALEQIDADEKPAPAARFALECALLDIASRRDHLPLRRWLSPTASDSVAVNAAVGPLRDVTLPILRASWESGFRVLKLKVGLGSPEEELHRLGELAHALPPGVALRLDANGAWSAEQAARVIDGLNRLPVDALEEPLRDPTGEALRRLQEAASFSLALDETLHDLGRRIELESLPVRRIVLKPPAVGSLRRARELAARAEELGIEVVFTSVLETAAGVWATLQLAASIPSRLAHGLSSSGWLAGDLGDPPVTAEGRISLPGTPGGGFCHRADLPPATRDRQLA